VFRRLPPPAVPEPALTVAIPTCNGARHLAEALRSILAQQGAHSELVVSDDRSEDPTLEIVRRVAGDRVRVEVNSERLGLAGNWNRCVERARTDWVAVFHQDDLMRPGHLAAHAALIAARPDLAFVASDSEPIDDASEPLPEGTVERGELADGRLRFLRGPGLPTANTFESGEFTAQLAVSNPVRCSAVTLSARVHRELGGFDPSFRYAVDWDYWLRAARDHAVGWVPEPTVAFRWHPASETHRFKTGTADLEEQERLLTGLFEQEGPSLPDAESLRRAANYRLARAYLNRAYDAARAGDRRLAGRCLRRAFGLRPASLGLLIRDPRFLARLVMGRS
jgi:GT2 family glycosyltransferase